MSNELRSEVDTSVTVICLYLSGCIKCSLKSYFIIFKLSWHLFYLLRARLCVGCRQQHSSDSAQLLMPLLHGEWVGRARKWVEIGLLPFGVPASTVESSQQGKCKTVYQQQMTLPWSTRAVQYTFRYFSIKKKKNMLDGTGHTTHWCST